MKVSFPTDDRKTIAKRTGRCKEFVIYNLSDSKVLDVSYIKNTHQNHEHHDHKKGEGAHNHNEIAGLLKDINVLVVGRIGKFMKKTLDDFGIKYQLTTKIEIQEVVDEFLEGID